VGAQERLALRLVALRLPPQFAAQRRPRAKAKARRDRSLRPSQGYLELLDCLIGIITERRLTLAPLSGRMVVCGEYPG
jgi:hypothetical protein